MRLELDTRRVSGVAFLPQPHEAGHLRASPNSDRTGKRLGGLILGADIADHDKREQQGTAPNMVHFNLASSSLTIGGGRGRKIPSLTTSSWPFALRTNLRNSLTFGSSGLPGALLT